jgi:hypothetical protein
MKTSLIKISTLCLLAGALFSSCKKEAGPEGPQGPAGTNGKNGNANVKSQISTNLVWTYNASTLAYETLITNPNITQDIVDKGAVLVYLQVNNNYVQLPNSSMFSSSVILFFDFEYYLGGLKITCSNSDLNNSVVPQSSARFKIVTMSASERKAYVETHGFKAIQAKAKLGE